MAARRAAPAHAAGRRLEAWGYRTDGARVTWRFRAFADPYQGAAGADPVAGTASLEVRAEHAVAFGFETDGETVAPRAQQFDATVSARLAASWAALRLPAAAGPPSDARGPRGRRRPRPALTAASGRDATGATEPVSSPPQRPRR